jgi:RNA polymerase sigma-70 factor, ECF subfamily
MKQTVYTLDESTLKELRSRDPQTLEELFKTHNPFLMRMLAAKGLRGERAEDAVFETWKTFFESLESFEGRSQIKTYLCGILINKMRESRRSDSRFVYDEDGQKSVDRAFSPDGWWNQAPADPSQLLEQKQTGLGIEECLEGLSPKQKEAFLLREVAEEDSNEICKILDVSITNLGVLIFRAKEKLRLCLEGQAALEGI